MPQTYPLQTSPSAPQTTYIYASQLGLALNCDLMTGLDKTTGLPAADDGPAINAAMAGATAHNPICLVMDGGSAVSGVRPPVGGHWSIQGFGNDTGFFVRSGSNATCIQNGTALPISIASPAAGRGANVSIRDIFINGNSAGNSTGSDTRWSGAGANMNYWLYNIYLVSLDNINIQNVYSYNSCTFQLIFENCGSWIVDGCRFNSTNGNTDGIHVNGPSNDGRITNCHIMCGDDPIALNANEGYGGLITRIAIDNCFSDSQTLGRIYTSSRAGNGGAQPLVDGVTWSNCQFLGWAGGLLIGLSQGPAGEGDSITNVTFSHCKFTSQRFVQFTDSVGTMTFDSCDWMAIYNGDMEWALFQGMDGNFQISMLNINNCRVLRQGPGMTAMLATTSGVNFKQVTVNGFSVVDVKGYTGTPLAGLLSLAGGGSISRLQMDAVDASNIAGLVVSGTPGPAAVAGGGVLQTGWQIADSAAVNGTPYLSSGAGGAPSIKVGGVARRLTLA